MNGNSGSVAFFASYEKMWMKIFGGFNGNRGDFLWNRLIAIAAPIFSITLCHRQQKTPHYITVQSVYFPFLISAFKVTEKLSNRLTMSAQFHRLIFMKDSLCPLETHNRIMDMYVLNMHGLLLEINYSRFSFSFLQKNKESNVKMTFTTLQSIHPLFLSF